MGEYRRKADGRRVFSTEFRRTTVQRILTGEQTLAELSCEPRHLTVRHPHDEQGLSGAVPPYDSRIPPVVSNGGGGGTDQAAHRAGGESLPGNGLVVSAAVAEAGNAITRKPE